MQKVQTLEQLSTNKKWIVVEVSQGKSRIHLDPDEIYVKFFKMKKHLMHPNTVKISFGENITKKMKWQKGDKLSVFIHPDDAFSVMITKSSSDKGMTLRPTNKTTRYMAIQFSWQQPIILEEKSLTRIDHLLINNNTSLVTRIN